MGKSSKAKGSGAEREIVKYLQDAGFEAERTLFQPDPENPRPDVRTNINHTSWEVKRVEKLNIWAAMAQAEKASKDKENPVVAFRRNREDWHVAIDLDYYLELVKKAGETNEYF